jgi:hypothetical protein
VSANRSVPPLFAATVQPFSRRRFFLLLPPHHYHRLTVTVRKREEKEIKTQPTKTKKAKQR